MTAADATARVDVSGKTNGSAGIIRRHPRVANAATAALLFIALPLLTVHAMPDLLAQADYLNLDIAVAIAVGAVSLNLLMGYAGQISLGHAGLLAAGAFASGIATSRWGWPLPAGMLLAVVATAALAAVVGLPALRLRGLYLAIVTVIFGIVMQTSVLRADIFSGGSAGVELPRSGTYSTYLVVCLLLLLLAWAIDVNVTTTKLGRAMLTLRENEAVAQSYGIDVTRYKLLAFALSGALAGLAGAMYGHALGHVNAESPFDLRLSLLLVSIVVVGGAGHRLAVIITALAFWVLPLVFERVFPGNFRSWSYVLGALGLMLTVALHPEGLATLTSHRRKPARVDDDDDELPSLPQLPVPERSTAPTQPGEPILEISDVSVRFGGLVANRDVSLVVPAGQIVGLIGPNGAGKSTLFNAVTGHVRAERGRIKYRGREIQTLRPDQRARLGIARSFQQVGLAKDLSVRDNFLLAQHQLASYGDLEALLMLPRTTHTEAEFARRADTAIEALGFADHAAKPVRHLSGGQQRIVEIACLLMTAPELVMLDEPSAGMAPAAAENLAERLRDLRDALGRTVLLIEHNVPLVLDTCDYVYVLDAGRLIAEGEPREIAANQAVIDAYFGQAVPA